MGRFQENCLILKAKKVQICNGGDLLSYRLQGVSCLESEMVESTSKIASLQSKVELPSYLDILEFYSCFIKCLSRKMVEMRKLLRKGMSFTWPKECVVKKILL